VREWARETILPRARSKVTRRSRNVTVDGNDAGTEPPRSRSAARRAAEPGPVDRQRVQRLANRLVYGRRAALVTALAAQARKAPVPTSVTADGVGRYPQDVEAAVYFCVLEALQNVAQVRR
jgi:hypothetical protein